MDKHKPLNLGSLEQRRAFLERACEADDGCISAGGLYSDIAKSLTLNDFAEQPGFPEQFKASFAPGNTEIWYRLNSLSPRTGTDDIPFLKPKKPRLSELSQSHVHLGSVAESNLTTVFHMMQDEMWVFANHTGSPIAMFLQARGAEHSGMCTGDVVKMGENAWMRTNTGWEPLDP
jgi:hypothetical protein